MGSRRTMVDQRGAFLRGNCLVVLCEEWSSGAVLGAVRFCCADRFMDLSRSQRAQEWFPQPPTLSTTFPSGNRWIKRPEGIKFGQRHDWACGIEAIDGGLLSESNGYTSMFLAPADSYRKSFEMARLKTEEQWGDGSGTRRFYLKSRSGQVFGRIELEVFSVYSPSKPESRLWIKYAINPASSRILR